MSPWTIASFIYYTKNLYEKIMSLDLQMLLNLHFWNNLLYFKFLLVSSSRTMGLLFQYCTVKPVAVENIRSYKIEVFFCLFFKFAFEDNLYMTWLWNMLCAILVESSVLINCLYFAFYLNFIYLAVGLLSIACFDFIFCCRFLHPAR